MTRVFYRSFLFFLMTMAASIPIAAQSATAANTAPILWQRYIVSEENVTILFPKLPVKIHALRLCSGVDTTEYAAYADGVGYVLRIKRKVKPGEPCELIPNAETETFQSRKDKLISQSDGTPAAEIKVASGLKGIFVTTKSSREYLLQESNSDRWFELRVVASDPGASKNEKFSVSINTRSRQKGIEIGDGSPVSLGDENPSLIKPEVSNVKTTAAADKDPKTLNDHKPVPASPSYPLMIVAQVPPAYTEEARKNAANGSVRLRIIFNANGTIGSIVPVTLLEYGLTERAVEAAKRLVFVPARRQNIPVTTSKVIEYAFNLY